MLPHTHITHKRGSFGANLLISSLASLTRQKSAIHDHAPQNRLDAETVEVKFASLGGAKSQAPGVRACGSGIWMHKINGKRVRMRPIEALKKRRSGALRAGGGARSLLDHPNYAPALNRQKATRQFIVYSLFTLETYTRVESCSVRRLALLLLFRLLISGGARFLFFQCTPRERERPSPC